MTDGSLPAAKARLERAIGAVFDPLHQRINGRNHTAPSLYQQLCDSVGGITGERSGGTAGAPLWPDAWDLKNRIVTALAEWQPTGLDPLDRIHRIEKHPYRPQDCQRIDSMSAVMETWPASIKNLLDPPTHAAIYSAACPACGQSTVHRKDSAGDVVRQAALQINAEGVFCQKCRATWGPERFLWLARVLG